MKIKIKTLLKIKNKKNINNDEIYYHIKCLPEYLMCPICKENLKNEECVDFFIDYDGCCSKCNW